jgi:zinc/manganese transport system substrate-binding protein
MLMLALLAAAHPGSAALVGVATTHDLAAVAREIGGTRIEFSTLAKASEDPHFVDAKPSFVMRLNRADVLIEGGAELEAGWLPPLVERSRNPRIAAGAAGRIVGSARVPMLEVPEKLDRSRGDVHAAGNPHYLTDPRNAELVAAQICDALCGIDAAGGDTFRANLERFREQLAARQKRWEQRLAPFSGSGLAAYHNVWPYFAHRFGLRVEVFLEPKPGIPPTPAHLAQVIRRMRADRIRVILVEPFEDRRTAERVATEAGATVLLITQYPGGTVDTPGDYFGWMDQLVGRIGDALAATATRP